MFATKDFPADGRAALAIVTRLMETLEVKGVLKPGERKEIVLRAQKVITGVGAIDAETKAVLTRISESL